MAMGWSGSLCRLVPLEPGRHIEHILRWVNDPHVTRWLQMGDWPLTIAAEQEWLSNLSRDATRVAFAIETFAGEFLGNVSLYEIDHRHGSASVGIVIGDPRNWGRGYGADSLRTLTRYGLGVLGLRIILAEVMVGNDASEAAFRKVGYQECGVIPQRYWKRGAYRDCRTFCFLRERLEDSELKREWGIAE